MRLTWKDARATLFVAAAVVFYALWLSGTIAADMSTRVAATIVFAFGWLACTSDVDQMKVVYGVDHERRPPLTYVVLASLAGGVALVSGIVAIAGASEAMLATLVVAMVVLWLVTTARHALARQVQPRHDAEEGLRRAA